MSAKTSLLALAALSQAALAAGCASVPFHDGGKKPTTMKQAAKDKAEQAQKDDKTLRESEAKIDKRARAEIGRQDILTQMTFWAKESAGHPGDEETAIKFSEALRKGGRASRAVEVASAALDSHPESRELLRQLGVSLVEAGRSGEALRPLALLCKADPKDWRARNTLGVALDNQGRFEEARQAYKEALAIKPDDSGVLTNFGVSYLLTGEAAKAEEVLKQAAALPDAGPSTRQNLALAVGLQGRFAEAEQLQRVDLPPAIVASNMSYLHSLLSDDRHWGDLKTKMR